MIAGYEESSVFAMKGRPGRAESPRHAEMIKKDPIKNHLENCMNANWIHHILLLNRGRVTIGSVMGWK
jgi:hypothetical protein